MAYFPVTPSGARTEESRPSRDFGWPLFAAALSVVVVVAITVAVASGHTAGAFFYPVDDAYIHLAAARRFVASGDRTFLAASSSIVWPWILIIFRWIGVTDLAPLLVNIAAAIALFFVVEHALRSRAASPTIANHQTWRTPLTALLVLLLVPIVPLVLSGMEHTAHACVVLALAMSATRSLARNTPIDLRILGLAALAVAFRYESFFVIAALGALLLHARRLRDAVVLGTAAALPAIVRGVWAMTRAEPFFPVPVLLKRTQLDLFALPAKVYYRLIDNPHVLVVLALLAFAWTFEKRSEASDPPRRERRALVLVALTTLGLQTTFAQLGWFYRYEAYALLLALVTLAICAAAHRATIRAFAIPLALLALPVVGRAAGSFRTTVFASENIFDQEMQMAAFIHSFYEHHAVALNDIGAVAYVNDVTIVDLMGLASPRVARARGMRIDGPLSASNIAAITHDENVDVAILYDDWFAGSLPSEWRKVGSWQITNNHVCAKDTVSFYATSAQQESILIENLRTFAPRLPPSVKQSGAYLLE